MKHCRCGCGLEVGDFQNYIRGHNRHGVSSCVIPSNKWAMKYDCCESCGTTEIKHYGKGLCRSCYKKNLYKNFKDRDKWSKVYESCIDCGKTDRPYKANGRCNNCYSKFVSYKKGVRKKFVNAWSNYYEKCTKCGTIEKRHIKNGLCYDCHMEQKRANKFAKLEKCSVCGAYVVKLWQHITMKSKKCDLHKSYKNDLLSIYFNSDFGLDDIAKELDSDRHTITKNFNHLFGKDATTKRNEAIKSCLLSEKSNINFNSKNRFGTVCLYKNYDNKEIKFRSKLEKAYAEFLDENKINWEYETYKFPYFDKYGKRRTYIPDFYLPKTDEFIEVKGYDRGDTDYKLTVLKNIGLKISVIREKDLIAKKGKGVN